MNAHAHDVRRIAHALLYEGYLLYPYRPSSVKNRQRWTFGGLWPAGGGEASVMQAEVLVRGGPGTRIRATVRFLHLRARLDGPAPWQEATERDAVAADATLGELERGEARLLRIPGSESADERGGRVREAPLAFDVTVTAAPLGDAHRLTVRVENTSAPTGDGRVQTELALLASTHLLLETDGGFVSAIDPPPAFAERASTCSNRGCWPILVGPEGSDAVMLASPITLYDHPAIAPESPSDLFDGTEIDEILTLRILTLTDAEKAEMAAADPRAAALLARVEAMGAEDLMRLHGVLRQLGPGARLTPGSRVRVAPKRRADALDGLLSGRIAVVLGLEQTMEDEVLVTVVFEDDPGRDLGEAGEPGHRFFFRPDELEAL